MLEESTFGDSTPPNASFVVGIITFVTLFVCLFCLTSYLTTKREDI